MERARLCLDCWTQIDWGPPALMAYDEKLLAAEMNAYQTHTEASDWTANPGGISKCESGSDRPRTLAQDFERRRPEDVAYIKASRLTELQAYLDAEKPLERLAALRSILENFTIALERNFSIA